MTIANTYSDNEVVGNPGMPNLHPGHVRVVNSGEGATRTLLASESGAQCLFDRAAGIVYTLPVTANIGTYYDFLATVSITSNSSKVITGSASQFLVGGVIFGSATLAEGGGLFAGNGSSTVFIASNGSTTGGLIGSQYRITKISATVWGVSGTCAGSGVTITPFG